MAGATRRDLLRRPLSVVADGGDAAILRAAIDLEQVGVFTYGAAVSSRALDPPTRALAALFADHEQEHADALARALRELGGTPPDPPRTYDDVDRALRPFGIATRLASLRDQRRLLAFALELETAAVAAYLDAHARLRRPKLLRTVAPIMANDGQHLAVLRGALGRDAVPRAFEPDSVYHHRRTQRS